MIRRDLAADVAHSHPLHELRQIQREIAGDARVWHALLLPIKATAPEARFVLTGHNVSHDCELCTVAGDFREETGLLVPWRASYPDCTSTDEEAEAYYTCTDDVVGRVPMPVWVIELFHAAFQPMGHTGWRLDAARLEALDAWGASLPAVGASRLSGTYMMIDSLFAEDAAAHPLPPEVHLPAAAEGESVVARAEPPMTYSVMFRVDPGAICARVDFPGLRALCAHGHSLDVLRVAWARAPGDSYAELPPPMFETGTTWHPLGQRHPAVPGAFALGTLLADVHCVTFTSGQLVIPAGDRPWSLLFHGGGAPLPTGGYTCAVACVLRRAVAVE